MEKQIQTSSETLKHFSHQLHSWCSERLQQKPGPFRQAELCQQFLGAHQLPTPPIVFWVNRESFIAGGLLILPQNKDEDVFATGHELARTFGLPCFFSWGRHEISCWSTMYNPPEKTWEYELPHNDISSPATFRKSLNLLLDQIELSFYDQQQLIPEVTHPYMANFVQLTLTDLLPVLQQSIQIEQSSVNGGKVTVQHLKNLLFRQVLLPIVLAACDIILPATTMEPITDRLQKATQMLPKELQRAFAKHPDEPNFPAQCHRRLNHYVNRVQQLKNHFAPAIIPVTSMLVAEWAQQLGGHYRQYEQSGFREVVVNMAGCNPESEPEYEIGPHGILAANTIIRFFSNTDNKQMTKQLISPLDLQDKLEQHLVVGSLDNKQIPSVEEQKKLNAQLRISWPNHKLSLASRSPLWVWQFLHICGLCDKKSQVDLVIPKNWLWERYGEKITYILAERMNFTEITSMGREQIHCVLKPVNDDDTVSIYRSDGITRILQLNPTTSFRSRVLMAMTVPDEIINLVNCGDLRFYEADQISDFNETGLYNYMQTSLGKDLWRLFSPGRPLPKKEKIATEAARSCIPLPGGKVLSALGKLSDRDNQASTADLDQELAVWLGATSPLYQERRQTRKANKKAATDEQIEQFLQSCNNEEIPSFPDNYIYNTPTDERIAYTFSGPLKIIDSFFDEIVLSDQQKKEMAVQGTKQAEALLLVSSTHQDSVELPRDQTETAAILDRYVQDLKNLRQTYYRHAVIYLPEEQIVDMVNNLWQKLALPDWDLIQKL